MYDMKREKAAFDWVAADPMMTAAEQKDFLQELGNPVLAAFGVDREAPLHSPDELPAALKGRANGSGFAGTAQPGEYYAFQVGVFANGKELKNLQVSVTDLVGSETTLSADGITCFNLSGIDCWAKPMVKTLNVDADRVQPLWFGVMIPKTAAGIMQGSVTVWADGVDAVTVPYSVTVSGDVLDDCGDSEPWRHSRLRWLNSTIAQDDEITAPYLPITVKDETLSFLGRKVVLSKGGLYAGLKSYFAPTVESISYKEKQVLARPMEFVADTEWGRVSLSDGLTVTEQKPGVVRWTSASTDGNLTMESTAKLEYDGYTEYKVAVSVKKPTRIKDISLTIPYTKEASVYKMGLGHKGSYRKENIDWKWDATLNQDTLWMGDVNAGLMVRLKGTNYEKPYMLIYYHYKPLNVPECWDNEGKGGVTVKENANSVDFVAYSGERMLMPGETVEFLFDLASTPVKTINKPEHWNDHYYHHVPDDLKAPAAGGANIINIHHATRLNPFINYPFFETEKLRDFVEQCHDNSIRAKIYYTIKELTVRCPEIWAFKSLDGEVLPSTYEIGSSFQGSLPYADEWLAKYMKEKYMTAWRQKVNCDGYDNAIEISLMTAPMSRFNNYFLEGLQWVLDNTGMDGLYFDDVAFDRSVMKRLRKIMDRHHPGCTIDLHSWNYFKNNNVDDSRLAGWGNSMNLYIDNFAFIDRLWFGEGFDYDETPDFWLVEMSGIPFGMMGEMLQNGGNSWRGMVYGMTCRLPNVNNPSDMWRLWKQFDLANATMVGYWNENCPVCTGNELVKATVYKRPERAMIALASWSDEPVDIKLAIDFAALGLDPDHCRVTMPAVEGFQEGAPVDLTKPLHLEAGHGNIIVLEHVGPINGIEYKGTFGFQSLDNYQ